MVFVGIVSAAGVSTPYWNGNPLKLAPGESSVVHLHLQNTGGEDLVYNVTINSVDSIATLSQTLYDVKAGSSGQDSVDVPVQVSVPANAKLSGIYQITSSFRPVSVGTGMVSLASGFTTSFPVEVVTPEESVLYNPNPQNNLNWTIFLIIIIGITLVVFAIIKAKKGKKNSKKFK